MRIDAELCLGDRLTRAGVGAAGASSSDGGLAAEPYSIGENTPRFNTVHSTATSWSEVLVPAAEWPAIRLARSPYFPEAGFGASVRIGVYTA